MLDECDLIQVVLSHMEKNSEMVRYSSYKENSGEKIDDITNIGNGGSNIGPLTVAAALESYHDATISLYF
ncbi:hypothetical protein [Bartonella australis]|uniref:hypothetical protein n=1 Tax=Bartonella australis TaxID=388640 RepID=UPI001FCB0F4C|nr:hypothetical protein [Bartonella australis]